MDEKSKIVSDFELIIKKLNEKNISQFLEILNWIPVHLQLNKKSAYNNINKKNHPKKYHPIRPQRGEVFVVDYGTSVGFEFCDLHLGLIVQNDVGNIYRDTVVVLPITDYKAGEKFDKNIHLMLKNSDFESKVKNGLEKDPSKIKVGDITTIDKARLGKKVGKLQISFMTEKVEPLIKELLK